MHTMRALMIHKYSWLPGRRRLGDEKWGEGTGTTGTRGTRSLRPFVDIAEHRLQHEQVTQSQKESAEGRRAGPCNSPELARTVLRTISV